MPLSSSGKRVMESMMSEYGDKKGKEVFYSSINKKKKGSEKWEAKKKAIRKKIKK